MIIGYARVSTVGQSLESQIEQLKEAGCEKIYQEKATGTSRTKRPQLELLLDNVRAGDTVKVTKIDRLARSIIDLSTIVNELNEAGISIEFIKDNLKFEAGSTSAMNTLIFNMLGAFAQFERDIIVQRTGEGRERAKKQGKHLGRPSQPKKEIERALTLYENKDNNGLTVKDIVEMTKVPRATIYNEWKKRQNASDIK